MRCGWRCQTYYIVDTLGTPCSLPLLKSVRRTLELTDFPILQRPVPSCLGSSCRRGTYMHCIWGSYCNPTTTAGHWTYLLTLLWPLQPKSHTQIRYPSWYYLSKLVCKMKAFYDLNSEKIFCCHEIILLIPLFPLAPVVLDLHNLILKNMTHINPDLMIP